MQKILYVIPLLCLSLSVFAQKKEYKQIIRKDNADINQRAILLIDTTHTNDSRRKAFNPIKGKYTVYVFLATYNGISFSNTEKEFHDIIVLKTDKKQRILQAFQYTLEWAEMPFSYDLYHATAEAVTLQNGLPVKRLNFTRIASSANDPGEVLNEDGILSIL